MARFLQHSTQTYFQIFFLDLGDSLCFLHSFIFSTLFFIGPRTLLVAHWTMKNTGVYKFRWKINHEIQSSPEQIRSHPLQSKNTTAEGQSSVRWGYLLLQLWKMEEEYLVQEITLALWWSKDVCFFLQYDSFMLWENDCWGTRHTVPDERCTHWCSTFICAFLLLYDVPFLSFVPFDFVTIQVMKTRSLSISLKSLWWALSDTLDEKKYRIKS